MTGEDKPAPIVVGWEEWLALPDLGLPAIRAKIDTGAKTSALHAFAIQAYGPAASPSVRFGVHPIPGREDIVRFCSAPIADRREVTSSNGEREARYVIRTRLHLAGRDWGDIETTLANRESMAYRMLLGRQAIRDGALVDPAASFLQPKLSPRLYATLPPQERPARQMRLALLAARPGAPSTRLLAAEAAACGFAVDVIPTDRLRFDFAAMPARLLLGDAPAPVYDAVIPRAPGASGELAIAAARHLEMSGATGLNRADSLERLRNPYHAAAILNAAGVPADLAADGVSALRCMVVDGSVVAERGEATVVTRELAARAAGAFALDIATVDVASAGRELSIVAIDAMPPLTGFGQGRRIARAVIATVEARLAGRGPVRRTEAEP